jgi:hypothetical protein
MNYIASITDFFKSPKWVMNLLLAGVCCIIPIVGPMVVIGWLITGFWARPEENFVTFPEFDFGKFGKNLERGLWPFLVGLVASIVIAPIVIIFEVIVFFILGAAMGRHASGMTSLLGMLLVLGFIAVVGAVAAVIMTPIYLRAARMQDFGPAFNFGYVKRFASAMWKEILIAFLFSFAVFVVLFIPGMIPCLGTLIIFLCLPAMMFMHLHLGNQIYKLSLTRGLEAIPLSPKLTTPEPPAGMPPVAPLPPAA